MVQIDTKLNPTGDVVVTAPDLSKAVNPTGDPFGPTGTIDGITYEAGPSPYTSGVTPPAPKKSLLEKTSEFITGQSVDENITAMRAKAATEVQNFLPETGKAMVRDALYQSVGLSPKPEDFRSVAYAGSVNLPAMEGTAIGTDFMTSPFQSVIQSVSPQFAMAHPYGLMAQQYNYNQYEKYIRGAS